MVRQFLFLIVLLPFFAGCMGPGGFGLGGHDSPIDFSGSDPNVLIAQVSQFQRKEIRQKLGTPIFSSSSWGFDLFRMDVEHDTSLFFTWLGLPFATMPSNRSIDHSRYTLVKYEQLGQGRLLQSGIVLNPTWKSSRVVSDYSKLYLRAGEVLFVLDPDWNRGVNVLATPVARDFYLSHAHSTDRCTVILGCDNRSCPNQLAVDETQSRKLPLRAVLGYLYTVRQDKQDSLLKDVDLFSTGPWLEALNAISLNPGEHILKFSAKQFDGSSRLTLTCRAGSLSFVVINPTSRGQELVNWQIEVTDIMPSQFSKRPLLLIRDGRWQVDQEFGHRLVPVSPL